MWDKVKGKSEAVSDAIRDKATSGADTIKEKLSTVGDIVSEFSASSLLKDFSYKAVSAVEEIDTYLTKTGSIYEVNSFRIAASASLVGGFNLDISFTKSSVAKSQSNEKRNELEIFNPSTGRIIKILRSACLGKETVKVKDPLTGEILEISVKTGEILPKT